MVREIVHDPMFLQRKSEDATQADLQTAQDLLDTLRANFDRCVGMAANMIGVAKKIIAINDNGKYLVMFNPEIISKFGEFETEEGCLSLDGERKTVRYKTIKVKYFNENFKQIKRSFSDFTAQIIQHEIDHCNGILIPPGYNVWLSGFILHIYFAQKFYCNLFIATNFTVNLNLFGIIVL